MGIPADQWWSGVIIIISVLGIRGCRIGDNTGNKAQTTSTT